MATVYAQYDKIDIYNVYAPKCNTQESGLFSTSDSMPEMNTKVTAVLDNFFLVLYNI
jgi:serine carboxypeptidase-like clade 2